MHNTFICGTYTCTKLENCIYNSQILSDSSLSTLEVGTGQIPRKPSFKLSVSSSVLQAILVHVSTLPQPAKFVHCILKFSSNYTSTHGVIQGCKYTRIHLRVSPTAALKAAIVKAIVQAKRKPQDAATDNNKVSVNSSQCSFSLYQIQTQS